MIVPVRTSLPDYPTRTIQPAGGAEALGFETARNLRHKARLAGMNPNHWYPVEWADRVGPGEHVATRFWSAPIVVFRGEDGALAAIEDRCPHRHLPLSLGKVRDCAMVCTYHGWAFDRAGRLRSVEHDTFGRDLPPAKVRSYPVRERYGLVWIFPGDPALADATPLPDIPDTEGARRWSSIRFDFTWKSHHSMVIDNLCNLTHLYTHGKWAPYDRTWMVHRRLAGEDIELVWRHTFRPGPMIQLYRAFLMHDPGDAHAETHSTYCYPYHVSHQGGARAINLMLPLGADETRVFTLYYWRTLGSDRWPLRLRRALMERVLVPMIRPSTVEVYRQDGVTVEAEMARLDANFTAAAPEVNPAVALFDRLTSERWQAWLDHRAGRADAGRDRVAKPLHGIIPAAATPSPAAEVSSDRAERRAAAG